jgi:hypothetical protein
MSGEALSLRKFFSWNVVRVRVEDISLTKKKKRQQSLTVPIVMGRDGVKDNV